MKKFSKLKLYEALSEPVSDPVGGNFPSFSTWNRTSDSRNVGSTSSKGFQYPSEKLAGKQMKNQLIDFAIDMLYSQYPQLIKDKETKMYYLNMIIGKVTNGNIDSRLELKDFIRALKKRGVKIN